MAEKTLQDYLSSGTPVSDEDLARLYEKQAARDIGSNRALMQGMTLGWGDEGEAALRAIPELRNGPSAYSEAYAKKLKDINRAQGLYSSEYPIEAATNEFVGGMLPMTFTGGASAPATAAKSPGFLAKMADIVSPSVKNAAAKVASKLEPAAPYAENALIGGGMGAVSGAGNSPEDRLGGAASGLAVGTGLGVAVPATLRPATSVLGMLRDKMSPDSSKIAAKMLSDVAEKSNMSPAQLYAALDAKLVEDRLRGIDQSTLMDLNPQMRALGNRLAGGSERGAEIMGNKAQADIAGAPDRVFGRVKKELGAGNYYQDLERMIEERRAAAPDIYKNVQQLGDIDDNVISHQLENSPALASIFNDVRNINKERALTARGRGEDPSQFEMKDIYRVVTDKDGNVTDFKLVQLPDFRTLDLMKRSLDAKIRAGFASKEGLNPEKAVMLKEKRDLLLNRMDKIAPEYKELRKQYADRKELEDAAQLFKDDFHKMDPEHISSIYEDLSDPAKEMARTGAARNIYGQISNSAERSSSPANIVMSKTNRERLLPLFDNDESRFGLFQAAMQREAELHDQAHKILKMTGREIEEQPGLTGSVKKAAINALTGSPKSAAMSLTNDAMVAASSPTMTPEVAEQLSKHLLAKDPKQVAAAVKVIEDYRNNETAKMMARTGRDRALTGGTLGLYSSPSANTEKSPEEIMTEMNKDRTSLSPDLESYLESVRKSRKGGE
jgi:hypothetical protein